MINRGCYGIILTEEDNLKERLQNVVVSISSTKKLSAVNVIFIGIIHICVPNGIIASTTSKFGE
jgi:hypothetical protein